MKKGTILFDDILTTIGEDAFKDCENITSITLPKKVNGILANAFQNCINLNEINYNGTSSDFKKIKFEANWNDNVPAEYAYCNDNKVRIKYNYLTFTALEDNCSIGFYNNPDSSVNPTIEYSFDKINWNTLTDNVTIENGSKMYCRGLNPNGISGGHGESGYNYFTGEGKFNVSGDIMSIIDYENTPETMVGTFYNLFGGNIDTSRDDFVDIVDASGLILSAKILTADCYQRMFSACISMVHGPQIKAEVLAPYCCWGMFIKCSSLIVAPELPATTLAGDCYYSMFSNCTSLTSAPELPATELADYCYFRMFRDCTSLTTAPVLPATVLATECYKEMFYDCSSLTTAPELPATTLTEWCYSNMFRGCTSLTTTPELPATELADYCYYRMFRDCTSLTTAPVLPATVLAEYCYSWMFEDCTKLNYIKCLATDVSAYMCTYGWVTNVSPTGTFVKHPDMSDWEINSVNGIPTGWTVNGGEIIEDESLPYVTFTAEEDGSSIGLNMLSTYQTLEYSRDTTIWNTFNTSTNISLNNGDKVYIRGVLTGNNTHSNCTRFKMSGKIAASGNCNAIWNYQDLNAPLKVGCGYGMFQDCTSLVTAPELPATVLAAICYSYMFYNCTSLVTAPELPAAELAYECYDFMFYNCTSLTTAPVLPATTLTERCYCYMFHNCTKLNHIACLATDRSAIGCTSNWVEGVSSTGTFIKHPNMNDWPTGENGIPSGWAVENAAL